MKSFDGSCEGSALRGSDREALSTDGMCGGKAEAEANCNGRETMRNEMLRQSYAVHRAGCTERGGR